MPICTYALLRPRPNAYHTIQYMYNIYTHKHTNGTVRIRTVRQWESTRAAIFNQQKKIIFMHNQRLLTAREITIFPLQFESSVIKNIVETLIELNWTRIY